MSRRSLKDILADYKIDPQNEYWKIYRLIFSEISKSYGALTISKINSNYISRYESFANACDRYFSAYPIEIRRTMRSVTEFIGATGKNFHSDGFDDEKDLSDLLDICELAYVLSNGLMAMANISYPYMCSTAGALIDELTSFVNNVVEQIGYIPHQNGYFVELVPKDVGVIEVAKTLPAELAHKVFSYRHRSLEGDLASKRACLVEFGQYLEPQRKVLAAVNKPIEDRIFSLLNNAHIRHNNLTPADKNYNQIVAAMSDSQLEELYDDAYELCLTACMTIESQAIVAKIKNVGI